MRNGKISGGQVEILLIEDNAADIAQILDALKKLNVRNRIHVLPEGARIQEFLIRAGPFAGQPPLPPETLILLSLNLRDVQALDVLRKIKSDERSKSLPVIVLTSSQEERGVMQGYKLGASACIVKPLDLSKFIEAVTELHLGWLLIAADEANGGGKEVRVV